MAALRNYGKKRRCTIAGINVHCKIKNLAETVGPESQQLVVGGGGAALVSSGQLLANGPTWSQGSVTSVAILMVSTVSLSHGSLCIHTPTAL